VVSEECLKLPTLFSLKQLGARVGYSQGRVYRIDRPIVVDPVFKAQGLAVRSTPYALRLREEASRNARRDAQMQEWINQAMKEQLSNIKEQLSASMHREMDERMNRFEGRYEKHIRAHNGKVVVQDHSTPVPVAKEGCCLLLDHVNLFPGALISTNSNSFIRALNL